MIGWRLSDRLRVGATPPLDLLTSAQVWLGRERVPRLDDSQHRAWFH
jgi:hypothetical protein